MSATADLLAFAGAEHVLPDDVRNAAIRLLGDTLAVGAAGVSAPGERAILETARRFGAGDEARLIGTGERLPAPSAAFVNGYRIHCLEWDAVHEPAVVHAMSVVVAALGAAIDRRAGCDADEALAALAVGVDIASGLGVAATGAMRFFRPATAGVIGAALAVARIDGAPLADALGLAYSSAAGTMQAHVEGSETLPFQIANAARAAITASDLARAGFHGPRDPLEGRFGYFALLEEGELARYTSPLGEVWRIAEVSTKPFPSGRASHGALASLTPPSTPPSSQRKLGSGAMTSDLVEGDPSFRWGDGKRGDDVRAIILRAPPLILRLIGRPYRPDMSPAHARLCLPWLAALMLTDGRIDPRRFTPEHFADPALAALAAKVRIEPDGNAGQNALGPQRLTIRFADGREEAHEIVATLGSPANPLTDTQRQAKLDFARELAPSGSDPRIFDDPFAYFTEPA